MATIIFKFAILLIVLSVEVLNGAIKCLYSEQNNMIQIAGNIPGYTCKLRLDEANNDWERVIGSHEPRRDDNGVKYVKKYFDFHSNMENPSSYSLKLFSSVFCKKFVNLKGIFFSKAGIEGIEEHALDDCKNLKKLDFGSNKFGEVNPNLIKQNLKLKNLWLRNNNLIEIPDNFFSSQSELETLDLAQNKLSNFPESTFDPLNNLKELNLQQNQIKNLNPKWLINMKNLVKLDLGFNEISELPSRAFQSLNNLKKLILKSNKIRKLNKMFFIKLEMLEILDLSSNNIFNLPDKVFNRMKNLKFLLINSNKLQIIHWKSFDQKVRLKLVNFDDNKIGAIDEEFVRRSNVSEILMANNFCSRESVIKKEEMEDELATCYEHYEDLNGRSLDIESCGKQKNLHPTIVNGQPVSRGEYPWVVSLERQGIVICGSTLISSKSIITAAHCIKLKLLDVEIQPSELIALVGAHDLNKIRETGAYAVAIKSTFVHPKWNQNSKSFDADIAILELDHEVAYTHFIQPICLIDPESETAEISSGVVVGYGRDENGKHESLPKFMSLPIIDHNECIKINDDLESLLSHRAFCGGYGNGTGACDGDSGSGLVVAHKNIFYLRGIVSSSLLNENTCDVQTHSVFTDVLKFNLWIKYTKEKIHELIDEDEYKNLVKANL